MEPSGRGRTTVAGLYLHMIGLGALGFLFTYHHPALGGPTERTTKR